MCHCVNYVVRTKSIFVPTTTIGISCAAGELGSRNESTMTYWLASSDVQYLLSNVVEFMKTCFAGQTVRHKAQRGIL